MKRPKKLTAPIALRLSVNDTIFVNTYFSSGRSAVKAYRASHPKACLRTAQVEAWRVLAKPSVQEEIARRVQSEGGITREMVQSNLFNALAIANAAKDAAVIASISMDCAKLAGFLVEKREVKTVDDASRTSIRDLVRQSISVPADASATMIPTVNDESKAESATVNESTSLSAATGKN